jgi:outer membrane receptor protein involved in Fe transport
MYNNQDFNSDKVIDETDLNVFFTEKEGKLTGASDLLLNGDVSYFKAFSNKRDFLATVTYNYFSDRVYAIGTNARGSIVDKAVGTLDLILKSNVTEKIALGLSVKNILDPKVERIQETQDVIVETYKKGLGIKFSVTYKF